MKNNKDSITGAEFKLLDIIWQNEPMLSRELVELAAMHLGWKKSTTYTILRRIIDQGVAVNENAVVRSLVCRDYIERSEGERMANHIRERFGDSLPKFIAAFIESKAMTEDEIDEVIKMLENYKNSDT